MYVVMGATGHIGSAVIDALLEAGERVIGIVHEAAKGGALRSRGVEVAVADARDAEALRAVFRRGRRAFLLNPPADPAGDTDTEELATVAAILTALDGSGLEKVVAASVCGARTGTRIGDLSVLYALEQGLRAQPIPAAINGGGYYYTNWDAMLPGIRETGRLVTPFPPDLALPMVSPVDLGRLAARRLRSDCDDTDTLCVVGPALYTSQDVADAFAASLGRDVRVDVIPRDGIEQSFRDLGFSAASADSYARMTEVTLDGDAAMPDDPVRGTVTLDEHVAALVAASDG